MKHAIIDLGSNTFHLLIIEEKKKTVETVFKEQIPTKIAQLGINQGIITDDATERALHVLRFFRQKIDEYQVPLSSIKAIGTSASVIKQDCSHVKRSGAP